MFLFEQLVRRELRQKYQGSVLGVAWYVVNPLVLMAAYWFLFDVVLEFFGSPFLDHASLQITADNISRLLSRLL